MQTALGEQPAPGEFFTTQHRRRGSRAYSTTISAAFHRPLPVRVQECIYTWRIRRHSRENYLFPCLTQSLPIRVGRSLKDASSPRPIALSVPHTERMFFHLICVAVAARRHTRMVMVPIVRRISETLLAHAAVIEWPSIEWSKENFPMGELGSGTWDILTQSFFATNWVACERHHCSLCSFCGWC